jgi:hypothetical protein
VAAATTFYRVYGQYADKLTERVVIRLHGPDRAPLYMRAL